jgi:hypothetical protein
MMTPRFPRLTFALLVYAFIQLVWNTWEMRSLLNR